MREREREQASNPKQVKEELGCLEKKEKTIRKINMQKIKLKINKNRFPSIILDFVILPHRRCCCFYPISA
jgi:hypothetical protein